MLLIANGASGERMHTAAITRRTSEDAGRMKRSRGVSRSGIGCPNSLRLGRTSGHGGGNKIYAVRTDTTDAADALLLISFFERENKKK